MLYLLTLFLSYSIGRASHILGGYLRSPHHWIYGVLAVLVGLVFVKHFWAIYLILFGLGFIISDLKDMIELKFYGIDDVKVKKFWGID